MQLGQKVNKSLDNLYNLIPGGIFGIIAMSFGLMGIFIPLLYYPTYDMFVDMVSHLGTPWKSQAYLYFDIFVILSGLINIPFVFYIGRVFRQQIGENKWIKVAIIWNCISSICLTLVGIFLSLSIYINDLPFILHGLSAIIMFSGVAIYCFIYSNLTIKKKDKFPRALSIMGYIVAGMQLAFLISWHSYIEWFAVIFLMAWIIIMSLYTLYKKY